MNSNLTPTLYAQRMLELENVHTLELPEGYISYEILPIGTLFIRDVYVAPEHRGKGIARDMLNYVEDMAKKERCTGATGYHVPSQFKNQVSKSFSAIALSQGFKIQQVEGSVTWFHKFL